MSKTNYEKAVEIVLKYRMASTSLLQRQMCISFRAAEDLMKELESNGVIGPRVESLPRRVLAPAEVNDPAK